jgi:hypothetical protein
MLDRRLSVVTGLSSPLFSDGQINQRALREAVRIGDYEGAACGTFIPTSARDCYFVIRALNVELAGARPAARGNANAARIRLMFFREMVHA